MTTAVIACGSPAFSGSGHIMTACLAVLAENGVSAQYVGQTIPFHWHEAAASGAECRRVPELQSGAVGPNGVVDTGDAMLGVRLHNGLIEVGLEAGSDDRLVLWGHYLFPYGCAAVVAAMFLRKRGVNARAWLTPAGSDVWEVLPQIPHLGKALLRDAGVERIVTYSPSFAAEVSEWSDRVVDVIRPCVDPQLFYGARRNRDVARRVLGLGADDFVISVHCNMRPVKDIEAVAVVAHRTAERVRHRRVVLLMSGPKVPLAGALNPLHVRQLGIVEDVRTVLAAADVELNLSRHDSYNLGLAEAMASGIPVISTDIVGIAPDILESRCGVLVPVRGDDCAPLAAYEEAISALCELATDECRRIVLGNGGARWAARYLTRSSLWNRLSAMLP
jgi:glycosyltransferase involved in cell wall biosynthesis